MNGVMDGWMRGRPLQWVLLWALLVLGTPTTGWAQIVSPSPDIHDDTGNGYVGIGTTTPLGNFQVHVGTNANLAFTSSDYGQGPIPRFSTYNDAGSANVPFILEGSTFSFVNGNVGIGTTSPAALLHVAGNAQVDGNIAAKYQDVAEWVPTTGTLGPGTVVVIDPQERNRVLPSAQPYDTRVAGVVSARPGLLLGEGGDDKAKVAHSGRVPVKVDAQYGPIAVGDLLVTSPTPGYAMRSIPVDLGGVSIHRPGTLVGKALEPLTQGQGEILVLLTLQ